MRLTRLYVAAPLASGGRLELPADAATHVARVLRAREGDPVVLFNGDGHEFESRIESVHGLRVAVAIGAARAVTRESPVALTLLQCLPRGDRMDWIVQKATELGIARIVPLVSRRSVVKISAAQTESKTAHWRAIAVAACEQSGRNRVPTIDTPRGLDEHLGGIGSAGTRLVFDPDVAPDPEEAAPTAAAAPVALDFAIGPEGGFEPQELDGLRIAGFRGVRLGPRILRTETAAIAALVWLQTRFGDLRGARPAARDGSR
ncbi:MAG: 16S rRNA (uracil(1498)-N(3))-methyltransferase [Gammaproteobacteria bacterium]|nr:16S rRNA (uracil(1498)-N(3))-methyltransferase [Gammaproteobacteria bacterium]